MKCFWHASHFGRHWETKSCGARSDQDTHVGWFGWQSLYRPSKVGSKDFVWDKKNKTPHSACPMRASIRAREKRIQRNKNGLNMRRGHKGWRDSLHTVTPGATTERRSVLSFDCNVDNKKQNIGRKRSSCLEDMSGYYKSQLSHHWPFKFTWARHWWDKLF